MDNNGASTTPRPGRRRLPRLFLVLLLLPLALTWVPTPAVRAAGPVVDLSRALAGRRAPPAGQGGHGRFLLTSVRDEHDPLWLWATRSLVEPGRRPAPAAAGPLDTMAQMRDAEVDAWQVAVNVALAPSDPATMKAFADNSPEGPMPKVDTKGLTGPSGGLMLALAFTDSLNTGDLTGGRTIAGTGTIDWAGTLGPIGYVAYKVRGAAAAGATVFFVPWDNIDVARRAAPASMQVVPVDSFVAALRWLCRNGAGNGACAKLQARLLR